MNGNNKIYNIILIFALCLALIIQTILQTNYRNYWGPYVNAVVWLVAGLAFSFLALRIKSIQINQNRIVKNCILLVGTCALGYVIYYGYIHLNYNFSRFDMTSKGSDVIPTIQIMVQRFLAGENVYAPIIYPNHQVTPTYFIFTWLPFVPAEILNWDYRWTAVILFLVVLLTMIYTAWWKTSNYYIWLIFTLFGAGIFYGLLRYDKTTIRFAVEFLPACYYLILCMTLFSKNSFIVSIGIILCILSRYTFLFWLPFYGIVLWHQYGWQFILKVGLIVVTSWLLIFLIPFFNLNLNKFLDSLLFYTKNVNSHWKTNNWQTEGSSPYILKQGYSLALFYYDAFKADIPGGVSLIRRSQLLLIFLSLGGMLFYYFKNTVLDVKLFLIVSLNVYLLIFYSFLYAPYGYLFFVPLTFSLGVLWWLTIRKDLGPMDSQNN